MLKFLLALILILPSVGFASFQEVDQLIRQAIAEKTLPGAVIHIGTSDSVLSQSALGTKDHISKNSLTTIYDVASLTKVIATATSILILEEQGKLRVSDKVSLYIPEFKSREKKDLTIEDLMRHHAGLASGNRALPVETFDQFISRISSTPLSYKPLTKTVYSDVGFILLGHIVEKVSGMSLNDFTQNYIFIPLRMNKTGYAVTPTDIGLCAPTLKNRMCVPHDPTAFRFYPLSLGHAGIFSTGDDIGRFARMYLNRGMLDGVRILTEESVMKMTVLSENQIRGLGWDLLSPYANPPRGEVFPAGISYGHTGYTGTSLWIDPHSQTYYVLLSNRVFNGEENTAKPFTALRRSVSTAIGKTIYDASSR